MVKYVKTEQGYVDASIFAPAPFKPEGKSYLTFSSPKNFTLEVNNRTKNWDGILEYFAYDKTWTVWDGTTILSAYNNDGEYVLYLRGTGNTKITGNGINKEWIITGTDVKCIGNIENLLDYITVEAGNHPTMTTSCYSYMFNHCTSLTQAPDLPATTLASHCYEGMFLNCYSLTKAPKLPATTLSDYCYREMFSGCISLTQTPALPATNLASYCYWLMFFNCNSLTQAPALPATTLASYCYESMFHYCTSLTQAPALPATKLSDYCYQYMFSSCTSLTKAPKLPATTLASYCYDGMFRGCIRLTQAPALPATTLSVCCYRGMFTGCISLTKAPALPATTLSDCCYPTMFSGCTSLTQAPALPATTLASHCYDSMFERCTALKLSSTKTVEYAQEYRIPTTGTGTTATDALTNMFVSTGGTFTGTPAINTTYYLSTDNMIVRDTEVATLNGYVGSMIDNSVSNPLNITGATVGQIAKITAVDESGNPTAWEAADIYEKPTSGIPKSDLTQSVQTSLDKADTAISYDSQTLTEAQQKQARTNIEAGQPLFVVNVTEVSGSGGYTADKTAAEIEAAYQAGRTIVCKMQARILIGYLPIELPLMSRTKERVFIFAVDQLARGNVIFAITVNISDSGVEVSQNMVEIYNQPVGGIPKSDLADDVQTSLDKADAAVSLGLTSATPGQIIKVKAVQDGKPTEWEAVDMPGGGGDEWELIAHINVADDVAKDVTVWEYNNLPRYKCIAYKKVNLVGSSEQSFSGCFITINNEYGQPSGMTYGKLGNPYSCIGIIYVMPFGWAHCKTGDANISTNYSFGSVSATYNALPLSDNAITSIELSAHPIFKIASGEIWLYGKKG